jgi:ribonucleoside-diphosphate reductase alpha chain
MPYSESGLVKDGVKYKINWDKLEETTRTGVLFLNRILDVSEMPIPECQEAMELTRKVGLGIMGLHDMLIQLGLPYDSEEGRKVAGDVMKFISEVADKKSYELGKAEGFFLGSDGVTNCNMRRNACLTTIAPTGTLSMIADCSSGCEPYYAPVTTKEVLDGTKFIMPNKWLSEEAKEAIGGGMSPEEYFRLNQDEAELFKGANDIHWSDHVKMQGVLQEHVDSSISKTINLPEEATVEDVKGAYELAYTLGCKGITVYRDNSRVSQVLSTSSEEVRQTEEMAKKSSKEVQQVIQEGESIDSFHDWPVPYKVELPDQLAAKRYRVRDHEGNKVYFTVCTMDGKPVEVFARLSEEKQDSYWHTICRLTSCLLRFGIPLDDVTKQLRKSSSSVADTPAKLARILDKYKEIEEVSESEEEDVVLPMTPQVIGNVVKFVQDIFEDKVDSDTCPECNAILIHSSGCVQCNLCGWEKCS